MTPHPNSLALEAFACGESVRSVEEHVAECAECRAFVERIRGAAPPTNIALLVAGGVRRERRRVAFGATTVLVPFAAAAAVLLALRTPNTKAPTATLEAGPSAVAIAEPPPETSFKGGVQVAVIRERAGQQARFTGPFTIKPGDRLRVEVALDRDQAILAAIMGEDASWLELMPEGVRHAGTHFSERSARVDASPLRGTILVGTPQALARARATRRFDEVAAIAVDWEGP